MAARQATRRPQLEELGQRDAPSVAGLMNALDHIPERMVMGGGQAIEHVMNNLEAQGGSGGAAGKVNMQDIHFSVIVGVGTGTQQTIVITKTTDSASTTLMSFQWGIGR
jgi:hypothetical protein